MSLRIITRSVWGNPGNRGQRLRKSLRAAWWQLRKRTLGSEQVIRLPNGVRFKAYPDCVVSSALIYAAWPEYDELMFMRRRLRAEDVIIDVGANVGHISMLLSDRVARPNILCFEPTPVTFARLRENWELNRWPTGALHNVAVGARAGTVFVPDVRRPDTTVSVKAAPASEGMVSVGLVCLDELRHLWRGSGIGLLKIDVEGYEKEVFRGGVRMLREDRPRLIMFESLSGSLDEGIAVLLSGSGYEVFQLDSGGRPDFSRRSKQNLFAVPEELAASLDAGPSEA